MIPEFVKAFEKNRSKILEELSKRKFNDYKDLVRIFIDNIKHDEYGIYYRNPDSNIIHEINDGTYEGSLLYLIPNNDQNPSVYFYVFISYGSCSGCDTLQIINSLEGFDEDLPTEEQIKSYMTLCTHILQGIKVIGENDDNHT